MISGLIERKPKLCFWLCCVCAFLLSEGVTVCGNYLFELNDRLLKISMAVGLACCAAGFAGMIWLAVLCYKKPEKPLTANTVAFALAAALQSYELSELCNDAFFIKQYPLYNLMGYAMYAITFLLGAVIFARPKIWFCVWEVIFAVYSAAQYYITLFRGAPLKFSDIANIRSAMDIKSEYKLSVNFTIVCVVLQTAAMLFLTIKTRLENRSRRQRLISLGSAVCVSAGFLLASGYSYDYGIDHRIIKLNFSGEEDTATSWRVGSLLMFYYDGVYNRVTEPEGYSTEKAEAILAQYPQESRDVGTPIIIGILNESFADISHISPVETDRDFLSVWHSLTENTIKGYVTVSPYGGYTCNSEYEFLTGNSMHFLPLGSAVFTNYLDSKQDSIVSAFNDMGFETTALTPCQPTLWSIGTAYEHLGFKYKYLEDHEILHSQPLYNGQPSDEAVYKRLIELVEQRDRSKGNFYWVTTMQNHAPFEEDVEGGVTLSSPDSVEAERYINCIALSDKALGELIDYFKDYDEKVVIVMFGDHYAHIEGLPEQLYGSSVTGLDAERYSLIHQTPYVIWSNRGLQTDIEGDISLNFLSAEMFRAAGLPLTSVQSELLSLRDKLPVVSSFGIKTGDGEWVSVNDEAGEYGDVLSEYETVQYYRMFDKNRKILK